MAEEQVGVPPCGRANGLDVDPPSGAFPLDRTVGDQLPRRPPARPGDRGARSDETPSIAFGPDEGADRLEIATGLLDRDDVAHGPIVEVRGKLARDRDQCRVGPGLTSTGAGEHPVPGPVEEPLRERRSQRPAPGEAPQRPSAGLPDAAPIAST